MQMYDSLIIKAKHYFLNFMDVTIKVHEKDTEVNEHR